MRPRRRILFPALSCVALLLGFQAVTANLAAHWSFESVAGGLTEDSTANNNDATLVSAPPQTPGVFGQGLLFDGTADYLTVPDSASLDVGVVGGSFTVAAWIRPTVTTGRRLINKWTGPMGTPVDEGFIMDVNSGMGGVDAAGTLRFRVDDGPNNKDVIAPGVLQNAQWQHVAAVLDRTAAQIRLYVNGTQVDANGAAAGLSEPLGTMTDLSNTVPLGIGTIPAGPLKYFAGAIDEVRLYSSALSSADVMTLVRPIPPTALAATGQVGQVALAWTASAGSLSYRIYRGTALGGPYPDLVAAGVTGTNFTDVSVNGGTTYHYVVRGFNTVESLDSNPGAATPTIPPPRTNDHEEGAFDGKCACGLGDVAGWAAMAVAAALALAAMRRGR